MTCIKYRTETTKRHVQCTHMKGYEMFGNIKRHEKVQGVKQWSQAYVILAEVAYPGSCSQGLSNYSAFKYVGFECTCWRLFQKQIGCTKLDIYVFYYTENIPLIRFKSHVLFW